MAAVGLAGCERAGLGFLGPGACERPVSACLRCGLSAGRRAAHAGGARRRRPFGKGAQGAGRFWAVQQCHPRITLPYPHCLAGTHSKMHLFHGTSNIACFGRRLRGRRWRCSLGQGNGQEDGLALLVAQILKCLLCGCIRGELQSGAI